MEVMKKALVLAMLLSGLLLYGCGLGGGTTASSNGSNPSSDTGGSGGGSQSDSTTVFTLKLVDSDKSASRTSTFGSLPGATDVRVVIRSFATVTTSTQVCQYDDNDVVIPGSCATVDVASYTEVYKDIQDVAYSSTVQIGIPAGTGYTLDVITSKLESGTATTHNILKYGNLTNVDIVAGQTNSATIVMTPLSSILNMTVADVVTSKTKFVVTLNNVLPIEPRYNMTMSFGADAPSVISNSTNTCTFTAPVSYTAGTISLQGTFTLNKSFLGQSDQTAQWTRLFPIASYNEQVYSNLNPLIAVTIPGI
jgi:hypothetical protein